MTTSPHERRHSATWPFVLIPLGVIWLLAEANVFSGANLVVLFRLWPIILIAFGLELLFGRSNRAVSLLIGGGTVVLLLALMVVGPALGLAPTAEVKTAHYTEPFDNARTAQINLSFSVGQNTVQAQPDPTELIDASLRYVGEVNFNVTSNANNEKFVTLSVKNEGVQFFDFLGLSLADTLNENELHWKIGLSPKIPLDLRLNGGVGDSTVDLTGLQISGLNFNTGVGNTTITLPGSGSFPVDLEGGVGSLVVNFVDGASVNAHVNAGVGSITLDVPDGAPVHLEANGGLGDVHMPANFTRISGDNSGVNHSGVWESAAYASASDTARINITFDGGVGELTVR